MPNKKGLTPIIDEPRHKVYTTKKLPPEKYNWKRMKMEFFEGPWRTPQSFLIERYNITKVNFKHPLFFTNIKGWTKEKQIILKQALEIATKKFLEERVGEEKKTLIRQQQIGKLLQSKGIKSLKHIAPKTLEEVRKLIDTGVSIENKALSLDKEKEEKERIPTSLTQVNVNLPTTRFDKLLDGLDYTGILRLVAEIRREKARRTGNSPVIEGEEATE